MAPEFLLVCNGCLTFVHTYFAVMFLKMRVRKVTVDRATYIELKLFALISFAIFVAIVLVAPMAGEDYGLTKLFQSEGLVERISYAIDKSKMQSSGWNARLGEQIAIFELSLPKWMSLTIYSISFGVFAIVVAMLSSKNGSDSWMKTAAYVVSFTFLLWPGMEVFFWKTANSGYLQPIIITMLVVIPYAERQCMETMVNRRLLYAIYLLICFLAGLSFENVPFAVAISLLILCSWEKRRNFSNYIPIIILLAGWMVLITAHSTSVRRAYYAQAIPRNSDPFIHYIDRFKDIVSVFYDTSLILFLLALVSLTYLYRQRLLSKYHACLVIASLLVVGSLLVSPYTEARSFLFSWCVMFSIFCYAFMKLQEKLKIKTLSTVLLFLSVCFGLYTLSIYTSYGDKLNSREQGIIEAIGTDKCKVGYEIRYIKTDYKYRYINNRDWWYYNNMINRGDYYNCNIIGG